jgi:hypothetical protein
MKAYVGVELEVGGQLHDPATLPTRKEPPVPIGQEVVWPPEPVWTLRRREKFLTLPGIEPRRYTD